MIVMKFGGTSNQDAVAMSNVIRIVKSHLPQHPFVVVSAIARATNELEKTARSAAAGDPRAAEWTLTEMFERHDTILSDLIKDRSRASQLREVFAVYRSELGKLVQGVAILRELTKRTLDAFCAFGERLSSRIIAAGLQEAGVDAVWLDAKEFMITDENFGRAMPVMGTVIERLEAVARPLMTGGRVPVTQGFIGATQNGVPTTMGRESSDFTASIIGAAMNADLVQIWTDVDGVMTADPRMVSGARTVERMSFEEAFELSYFGAKVLHPNTMLPLLEKNIPVEIRNSRNAQSAGTLVDREANAGPKGIAIKSIAYSTGLSVIVVRPRQRIGQYLFWEGVFSVLGRHDIPAGNVCTSEYSIAFTLTGLGRAEGLVRDLAGIGLVEVFTDKGSVCVIGNGMRGSRGVMERVFGALSGLNITLIAGGASDLNVTVVLEESQIQEAVDRLHREFFFVKPEGGDGANG